MEMSVSYDYNGLTLFESVNEIYSIVNELKMNSTEKEQLLALYKHIVDLIQHDNAPP